MRWWKRFAKKFVVDYLYCFACCGFASIAGGLTAFYAILRWFPVAEMLRSLALDSLLFVLLLLLPARFRKALLWLVFPFIFVTGLFAAVHVALYQSTLSIFAVQAVLETSLNEAAEFVADHFATSHVLVLLILLSAIGVLIFRVALRALPRLGRRSQLFYFALAVISVVGWHIHRDGSKFLESNATYVVVKAIFRYPIDAAIAREQRSLRNTLHIQEVRLLDKPASARRTYVFIIGESVNRNRMSLYGYHRPTSPRLKSLLEQGEILPFTDVISSHTHTVGSLHAALLFHTLNSTLSLEPSLLTLMNQAGFATWWISNQTANSSRGSSIALISGDAKYQIWLNRARHEGRSVIYDDVLLPALDKALRDPAPNKAIFLHMIGAHLTYALRYPPEENFFTKSDDIPDRAWRGKNGKHYINTYDNAIHFTDKVVDAVIRMVQQEEGHSLVVFFSDHGQEVYDLRPIRGQDSRNPTRNMIDIPFILWFSRAYVEANPALVTQARLGVCRSVNRPKKVLHEGRI